MKRLVWFRNDLRLHDNEMLTAALGDDRGEIAYVFIYDEKWDLPFDESHQGMGSPRKKYLAESVQDLQHKLNRLGAKLICAFGDPADVVPSICYQLGINQVFYSRLSSPLERQAELSIGRQLQLAGVEMFSFQTHTLVCDEDIKDFDLYQTMSFSKLRKYVEKSWPVRSPLKTITRAGPSLLADVALWNFEPTLLQASPPIGIALSGGETSALARLNTYFWEGDHLQSYKKTRNGLLALNDSSKFSPALALGCLSARTIFAEVRRYERERISNSSTLWFLYELLWRDHFHFAGLQSGLVQNSVQADGLKESVRRAFYNWQNAQTGHSFIDAAMKELRITGWLSNRMRQNVASFLVHDLGVDWRMGARWFETCLVDDDPCSNWGNWAYIAGADADQKPHIFNIDQQARAYDPSGEYVNYWSHETPPS